MWVLGIGIIEKTLVKWFEGMMRWFVQFLADVANTEPMWEAPWAKNIRNEIILPIAISVLALMFGYQAWKLYIARESGETSHGPAVLLRRMAAAVLGMGLSGWFVTWMAGLSRQMTLAIGAYNAGDWADKLVTHVVHSYANPLPAFKAISFGAFSISSILLIVLLIIIILVWIQSFLRGAELTIAYVMGPLLALSAVGEDEPLSNGTLGMLLKEILVLTLTQVVQMVFMVGIIDYIIPYHSENWGSHIVNSMEMFSPKRLMAAIAVGWVALKAPSILRNYLHASGPAQGGGGGQMLMMAARLMMKAPI
jgi:hypothetical protein